jgi:predicted nucleic acid-binding protein
MMGVLLDSSVVLKYVLPEELSDRAVALIETGVRARQPLFCPPLLLIEIEATNVIHQQTRRQTLSPDTASAALTRLLEIPLQREEPSGIYQEALGFARSNQIRSAYDALYVVTAEHLGVEFWTADQRLINSLGTRAPWVRWIGNYAAPPEGSPGR